MYDSDIMRRTQIYLDELQDRRLAERARAAGVSKSTLIRTAIDTYLESQEGEAARLESFREAVRAVAGAAPGLSPGADYADALRDADRRRHERLKARRRG
jgi:hypothetical protein